MAGLENAGRRARVAVSPSLVTTRRLFSFCLGLMLLAGCSDDDDVRRVPSVTATRSATSPPATATVAPSATPTRSLPGLEPTETLTSPPSATPTMTAAEMCPTLGSPSPTPTMVTPQAGTPTVTPTCLVSPPPDELGQYGSDQEVASSTLAPLTLPPYALTASGSPGALPGRVVLTNLPAVSMQGTFGMLGFPGSCEAQAFGYGLGSYTAARTPSGTILWNPADPINQVSAAYLFALALSQGVATCSKGPSLIYLEQLVTNGAPSAVDVPYQPYCCYFGQIDVNASYPDAARFHIGSFTIFKLTQSTDNPSTIELFRRLLAAGHAIAFSGPVFHGYSNPTLTNGVFAGTTGALIPGSGHAQMLVGYDDSMGGTGAFLVQNSFGTCWPPAAPGGTIWWAYDTFLQSQNLTAVAYPLADQPPSGTQLDSTLNGVTAYVTAVNHWVDPNAFTNVYIIVQLQFSAPVFVNSITLTEPGTGVAVQQQFNEPMANGYAFIERKDGHQFLNGTYGITVDVTAGGSSGQFTGSIAVGQSVPTTPTPAPIGTTDIYGSTGAKAAVTPG